MDHPTQTDFLRWIVFLPLIGAVINGVLGAKIQKRWGKGAIAFIACVPVVIAFGLSLSAFFMLKGMKPEARFLIVGTGPDEDRLKTLAHRKGVADRVVFAGHRDGHPA